MLVTNKINIAEIAGKDCPAGGPTLTVESHAFSTKLVVIRFKDQPSLTVDADDLIRAIANAKNHQ